MRGLGEMYKQFVLQCAYTFGPKYEIIPASGGFGFALVVERYAHGFNAANRMHLCRTGKATAPVRQEGIHNPIASLELCAIFRIFEEQVVNGTSGPTLRESIIRRRGSYLCQLPMSIKRLSLMDGR